jgi:hypothetical protein
MTKQCQQSNVANDSNDGNGGDVYGNDAAATTKGYDVNEDDNGNSRIAIG